MLAATLTLALLTVQDDSDWQTHRLGKSGLRLDLPVKPNITETTEETQLTATFKSVKVSIIARPATAETKQNSGQAYSQAFGELRDRYGRKIKSILNENPVLEAFQFGAEESLGFVIETDEQGGKAHAWQQIYIDNFEYTIQIESSRRDQVILEKILASAQYINPETGDFRVSALGNTGLESYLGIAFLPQTDIPRSEANSVVLQSDQFPAMVLATVWTDDSVDYEDPDELKTAMTKWLTTFVQGAESKLTLTPSVQDNQTTYDIKGEVIVQGVQINLLGKAFARRDDAQVAIAVIDPRTKNAEAFAKKILASVKQKSGE
jgi:hypothetical protein